jgi:hypothetical protein
MVVSALEKRPGAVTAPMASFLSPTLITALSDPAFVVAAGTVSTSSGFSMKRIDIEKAHPEWQALYERAILQSPLLGFAHHAHTTVSPFSPSP